MGRRVRLDRRVHPLVHDLAVGLQKGRIDHRNFLRTTTLLGNQYCRKELDAALDEPGTEPDVDQRRTLMKEMQQILQDDAVMSQPVRVLKRTAASRKVKNYELQPTLRHQFHKTWIDA